MRVAAVAMVKDEADIVEATVRHMATQVDDVWVADNGSTDGTRDILSLLATELGIHVLDDPEVAYFQSEKMTRMARAAVDRGARWVVPFDADEIWYSPLGRVGDVLASITPGVPVTVEAEVYDHVPTAIDDPDEPDATKRMVWRRLERLALPKVAARKGPGLTIAQGNHSAWYDGPHQTVSGKLSVRHFPYRSVDQFVRKVRNGAAAYEATGDRLSLDTGAHWRQWGEILRDSGEEAVADIFLTWFWSPDPTVAHELPGGEIAPPLIKDPAPLWLWK